MDLLQRQLGFCQENYLLFLLEGEEQIRISYMCLMQRFAIYPKDSCVYEDILTYTDVLNLLKTSSIIAVESKTKTEDARNLFSHEYLGSWKETKTSEVKFRLEKILNDYMQYFNSFFKDVDI